MLSAHLPALQVILPLLAAPLSVLMGNRRLAWLVSLASVWAAFAVSLLLLARVQAVPEQEIRYFMGNWQPPFGIEYRVDLLSASMLVLVSGMAALMLPYAMHSVRKEIPCGKCNLFYAVFLLCLSGLLGIIITNDAFNLYVFLEISSLATYTLIAMGRDRRAVSAAFQYLILGTIGATFILIGIGLLYQMTGTLNFTDLAQRLEGQDDMRPVRAAFAFFVVGLCLKLALFPLHMWLPNAYAFAPSFISAFLAATATKVSVYALLRILFTVFGENFTFAVMPFIPVLTVLSLLAIVVGSLNALYQTNIKTLLAFSSISQTGYITLAIAMGTPAGTTAAIIHVINHSIIKGALFLVLGAISYRLGKVTILEFQGIGRRMPVTVFAFVLGALGLMGMPFTAGFISKWYLLTALIEHGAWFRLAVVVFGSLLALIYLGRMIELAYFFKPSQAVEQRADCEAPLGMMLPVWILIGLSLVLGVYTEYSAGLAQQACEQLLRSHARF